jgi:hypothetical protein
MSNLIASRARQIATRIASSNRTAAPVLWKYVDDEGKEFFLTEKLMTIKSPYTGKSFKAKPEKHSLTDVGKGLKEDEKAERESKTALWRR